MDRSKRDTYIDLNRTRQQTQELHQEGSRDHAINTSRQVKRHGLTPGLTGTGQPDHAVVKASATRTAPSESPWKSYEKLFTLQFGEGNYYAVAEKRKPESKRSPVVMVKEFPQASGREAVKAIQKIRHEQFVTTRHVFARDGVCTVMFEYMPLSLSEMEGHPLLNDIRLASILGQVGLNSQRVA